MRAERDIREPNLTFGDVAYKTCYMGLLEDFREKNVLFSSVALYWLGLLVIFTVFLKVWLSLS